MREVVLDVSVVWHWVSPTDSAESIAATQVETEVTENRLLAYAPSWLGLELLNAAARRHSWTASELGQLAAQIDGLAIEISEPALTAVAYWAGQGLTAYDAAYVALAEALAAPLITDDRQVAKVAGTLVEPLVPAS